MIAGHGTIDRIDRKIGGGYMFIHRMLLEWFAARYVEPGTCREKDPSSGGHNPA